MPTLQEIRERSNILGQQIEGTPYFNLTIVAVDGFRTSLGAMTVTAKQMMALFRNPDDHAAILATSRRMPDDG
jgi:hypothetical protein